MEILNEIKQLCVYKKLLDVLSDYTDKFPATGVDKMLDNLIINGIKSIPNNDEVKDVLKYILSKDNYPMIVQDLLNLRFSDLPTNVRPIYLNGRKKEVAFWCKDGKIFDKVVSLIDLDKASGKGFWSDSQGNKVKLIEL